MRRKSRCVRPPPCDVMKPVARTSQALRPSACRSKCCMAQVIKKGRRACLSAPTQHKDLAVPNASISSNHEWRFRGPWHVRYQYVLGDRHGTHRDRAAYTVLYRTSNLRKGQFFTRPYLQDRRGTSNLRKGQLFTRPLQAPPEPHAITLLLHNGGRAKTPPRRLAKTRTDEAHLTCTGPNGQSHVRMPQRTSHPARGQNCVARHGDTTIPQCTKHVNGRARAR